MTKFIPKIIGTQTSTSKKDIMTYLETVDLPGGDAPQVFVS